MDTKDESEKGLWAEIDGLMDNDGFDIDKAIKQVGVPKEWHDKVKKEVLRSNKDRDAWDKKHENGGMSGMFGNPYKSTAPDAVELASLIKQAAGFAWKEKGTMSAKDLKAALAGYGKHDPVTFDKVKTVLSRNGITVSEGLKAAIQKGRAVIEAVDFWNELVRKYKYDLEKRGYLKLVNDLKASPEEQGRVKQLIKDLFDIQRNLSQMAHWSYNPSQTKMAQLRSDMKKIQQELDGLKNKGEAVIKRGIKVTLDAVAQFCNRHHIAWKEEDLEPVATYLNGKRLSMDYDKLQSWPRMIVDQWEKVKGK